MPVKHTVTAKQVYYFELDAKLGEPGLKVRLWDELSAREQSQYKDTTLELDEAELREKYNECEEATKLLNAMFGLNMDPPGKEHAYNLVAQRVFQQKL